MFFPCHDKNTPTKTLNFNPQKMRGGRATCPKRIKKLSECWIDMKPGCKSMFFIILKFVKQLINLDHEGTLEGPLFARV